MNPPEMAGWNLALRFALEIVALIALAVAAWKLSSGALRWILVLAVPLAAAVIWGVFNVSGDPSRSGSAPIEVGGSTRLAIELAILGAGATAIWIAGQPALAIGYAALVVVQYSTSLPRIHWLLDR